MNSVTKNRRHYSMGEKRSVVAHYAITGSFTKVSKLTGIPFNTVSRWHRQDWFTEMLADINMRLNEQAINIQTVIATESAEILLDRMRAGDHTTWRSKDGELIEERTPMKTSDVIQAGAQAERSIKSSAVMGQQAQHTQSLQELSDEFRRLAQEYKRSVIDVAPLPNPNVPVVDDE